MDPSVVIASPYKQAFRDKNNGVCATQSEAQADTDGHVRHTLTYLSADSLLQLYLHGVVVEADGGCALFQSSSVHEELGEARLAHVAVSQKHHFEHLCTANVELRVEERGEGLVKIAAYKCQNYHLHARSTGQLLIVHDFTYAHVRRSTSFPASCIKTYRHDLLLRNFASLTHFAGATTKIHYASTRGTNYVMIYLGFSIQNLAYSA